MSAPPGWEPWHRQAGEPELAFALLQQFLAVPAPRDLRRFARTTALPWPQVDGIAWEWFWTDRARLWDAHLDGIRTKTIERLTEEKAIQVAERQLRLLVNMQSLAGREIEKLLAVTEENAALGTITPRDALRMIGVGVRLERLIRGEPTERTDIGPDLSGFTAEELRALRAA